MQVIFLMEVILPFIDCVLKSAKSSSLKIKQKNMRTFHVQLQFKQWMLFKSLHCKQHMQYWLHLINLVTAQFKRNQKMIRVLLKKINISKQKTKKQKVVASAKKDANK